jgi:hypothetical protein
MTQQVVIFDVSVLWRKCNKLMRQPVAAGTKKGR